MQDGPFDIWVNDAICSSCNVHVRSLGIGEPGCVHETLTSLFGALRCCDFEHLVSKKFRDVGPVRTHCGWLVRAENDENILLYDIEKGTIQQWEENICQCRKRKKETDTHTESQTETDREKTHCKFAIEQLQWQCLGKESCCCFCFVSLFRFFLGCLSKNPLRNSPIPSLPSL